MNKKLIVLGLVGLLSILVLSPKVALAYKGDPNAKGPNYTPERHEAMEKAFETNDYNAWKALMDGKGRVTQVINEKNFAQFAKAHELAEEGSLTEANKIREELGLGKRDGSGNGKGAGCRADSR